MTPEDKKRLLQLLFIIFVSSTLFLVYGHYESLNAFNEELVGNNSRCCPLWPNGTCNAEYIGNDTCSWTIKLSAWQEKEILTKAKDSSGNYAHTGDQP